MLARLGAAMVSLLKLNSRSLGGDSVPKRCANRRLNHVSTPVTRPAISPMTSLARMTRVKMISTRDSHTRASRIVAGEERPEDQATRATPTRRSTSAAMSGACRNLLEWSSLSSNATKGTRTTPQWSHQACVRVLRKRLRTINLVVKLGVPCRKIDRMTVYEQVLDARAEFKNVAVGDDQVGYLARLDAVDQRIDAEYLCRI